MDLANINVLEAFTKQEGIGRETIVQIKKDFLRNGLEVQLNEAEDPAFDTICSEVADLVDWLLTNDRSRFMNLLYRIDIAEKLIHQALEEHGEKTVPEKLASMIVKREAQKVLVRRYFSGK
jgi:hypothetical protein